MIEEIGAAAVIAATSAGAYKKREKLRGYISRQRYKSQLSKGLDINEPEFDEKINGFYATLYGIERRERTHDSNILDPLTDEDVKDLSVPIRKTSKKFDIPIKPVSKRTTIEIGPLLRIAYGFKPGDEICVIGPYGSARRKVSIRRPRGHLTSENAATIKMPRDDVYLSFGSKWYDSEEEETKDIKSNKTFYEHPRIIRIPKKISKRFEKKPKKHL